jgi:pyrroline-5-carboxylate reductase
MTTLTTFLTTSKPTYLFYLIDFYLRALVKNSILLDISYSVMFNLL